MVWGWLPTAGRSHPLMSNQETSGVGERVRCFQGRGTSAWRVSSEFSGARHCLRSQVPVLFQSCPRRMPWPLHNLTKPHCCEVHVRSGGTEAPAYSYRLCLTSMPHAPGHSGRCSSLKLPSRLITPAGPGRGPAVLAHVRE